jgi:membrane protein
MPCCGQLQRRLLETGLATKILAKVPPSLIIRSSPLGPIIVIAIAIAGFFFGREAVDGQVASTIKDMPGETGAQAIQAMLADAARPREGLLATLLGLGSLIFAAIGVVVQLKDALNPVWEVGEPPGHGLWHFTRN